MKNVINFNEKLVQRKLKQFTSDGVLDESIYYQDGNSYFIKNDILKYCDPDLITEINKRLKIKKISEFVVYSNRFESELIDIKINLKTHKSSYKFPTILSKYRKGINPVTALYNELQEALFLYDENKEYYSWVISVFKDEKLINNLLQDIESDIESLLVFVKKYDGNVPKSYNNDIKTIKNIIKNLMHYYEVFSILKTLT